MTQELLAPILSFLAAFASGGMVLLATLRKQRADERDHRVEQEQSVIDGLRADIAELDTIVRQQRAEVHEMARNIERLRSWAYQLVRLLSEQGIENIPPEPEAHA